MAAPCRISACLATAFILLVQVPAMARAEEPAIVKMMLDNVEQRTGQRPTYGSLDDSNGTITIKGLAMAIAAEGIAVRYGADTIVMTGVREAGDGRYTIDSGEATGFAFEVGGKPYARIPLARTEGVYVYGLPADPSPIETLMAGQSVARLTRVPLVIVPVGANEVRIEHIDVRFEGDPWALKGRQTVTVDRIAIPEGILSMAPGKAPFRELGYTALEFSMDGTSTFDASTETLFADFDMGFTGRDIGTLRVSASLDKVPLSLLVAAQKVEPGAELALLGEAAKLAFSKVRVSFIDDSLTNRLIDFAARTQKLDKEQLIATAGATVQLGLMQLRDQAFTARVIAAVNAFLAAPGSIAITAAPAPVTIEDLMGAGEDPVEMMKVLQVDVTANE